MRGIIYALLLPMAINASAQDAIIYRDGRVKSVKIIQTNNDKTLFKESDNKKATEEYVENTKVFMLKFKTRGNVVFNSHGERILTTSEHTQIPKDAIVVYSSLWMRMSFHSGQAKKAKAVRYFLQNRRCL